MTDRVTKERVLAQLSPLGNITSRPMFGGHGTLLAGHNLRHRLRGSALFKVDEQSKGDYVAEGMGPFRPNERQTLKSYYEVPPDVLDDPEGAALVGEGGDQGGFFCNSLPPRFDDGRLCPHVRASRNGIYNETMHLCNVKHN